MTETAESRTMNGLTPKQLKKLAGGKDSAYVKWSVVYEGCGFWATGPCAWAEPFPAKYKETDGKRRGPWEVRTLPQSMIDGVLAGILGEVAPVEICGMNDDLTDVRVRLRGPGGECILSARQLAYGLTVAKAGPKAEPTYHLAKLPKWDGIVVKVGGVVKAIVGAYVGAKAFDNPTWSFRVRGEE